MIKDIPASRQFVCDVCGKTETTITLAGRPKYWADLIIAKDAYDFQGCAVADGSVKRMLCGGCTEKIADALNATAASIRALPLSETET